MSMRKSNQAPKRRSGRCAACLCVALSLLLAVSASLLLARSASAQSGRKPQRDPNNPQQDNKPVLRLETKEVIVPLSAYDAEGKLVNDLTTKDVMVIEDGEPRPVSFIRHEPANVVIVLDLNNELGTFKNGSHLSWLQPAEPKQKSDGQTPLWQKQENYQVVARPATHEFADNLVGQLSTTDSVAIIQYANRVQLVQDWTSDRQAALAALRAHYRIGLKGRLHDALKLAAEKLEERPTGRRVVVLISDGLDSASKASWQQATTALTRAHATAYVVGWVDVLKTEVAAAIQRTQAGAPAGIDLLGNARKRIAELYKYSMLMEGSLIQLRNLAESSGGEMLLPPSYEALVSSPKRLTEEIGAQYSLAFISESKPSLTTTREIQVMPARSGLTVRSRRNYWVTEPATPLRIGNFMIQPPTHGQPSSGTTATSVGTFVIQPPLQ